MPSFSLLRSRIDAAKKTSVEIIRATPIIATSLNHACQPLKSTGLPMTSGGNGCNKSCSFPIAHPIGVPLKYPGTTAKKKLPEKTNAAKLKRLSLSAQAIFSAQRYWRKQTAPAIVDEYQWMLTRHADTTAKQAVSPNKNDSGTGSSLKNSSVRYVVNSNNLIPAICQSNVEMHSFFPFLSPSFVCFSIRSACRTYSASSRRHCVAYRCANT